METEKDVLIELLDCAFCQIAAYVNKGTMEGWWDTCAISTARDIGDYLVKEGSWERYSDGYGRRWFYRRKK